jgi:peptidyl-tRNA hydrolase, PTH1 family
VILVAGLGNPGPRYAETRHNVGFMVVDRLVDVRGGLWRSRFSGQFVQLEIGEARVAVLKPETFMNDSGRSVGAAAGFFKIAPERVLVVHDELDLPFGTLRLKRGGGEAGHNGLRSVAQHLGRDFVRLRMGIGKPPPEFRGRGADFVLQGFAPAERERLGAFVDRATEAVVLTVERGLDAAMNAVNRRED